MKRVMTNGYFHSQQTGKYFLGDAYEDDKLGLIILVMSGMADMPVVSVSCELIYITLDHCEKIVVAQSWEWV